MLNLFCILLIFLSLNVKSETRIDRTLYSHGVRLESLKAEADRTYTATIEKNLPFDINFIKKSITNFNQKCNNDFKNKRKFSSPQENCKYHNEHIIETIVYKDIRPNAMLKDLTEYYLISRQIYNRGQYGFYELVQIKDEVKENELKSVKITIKMLNDEEVKVYTSLKFHKESAFDQSTTNFLLTKISANETKIHYQYSATTDHWLLNKEVSVPQVFESIGKSVSELLQTIEQESHYLKSMTEEEE